MQKLKKYGSIVIVFIGLGLIFFHLKSKAPSKSSLEFVLPSEGVDASRIMLEYRKVHNGREEAMRRVEKFPKAAISKIIDEPSLPEGEYIIILELWIGDEVKSFERHYSHGSGGITRFEINP